MNRNNRAIITLSALSTLFACSQGAVTEIISEPSGTLSLALSVSGLSLTSVRVDIESETLTSPVFRSRSIDVSDENSLLMATEAGLPRDTYTIGVNASPVDDPATAVDESQIPCVGQVAGVSVVPGQVTEVNNLVLLCTLDGGEIVESGGVRIQASVGVQVGPACGELISEMFVGGQQTSMGGEVVLHAVVDPAATFTWAATAGSIAAPNSADTTYTCPLTPGTQELSLVATTGESCSRGLSVSVSCVGEAVVPVCGDGIVNGNEQCDGGEDCASDCTLIVVVVPDVASTCETCLTDPAQEVAFRDFNEQLCNADELCVAVKKCVLNDTSLAGGSCFSGIPAECYCGIGSDLEACETDATFVATGPCAAEILAGAGSSATPTDVLPRFFDPGFSTGAALAIVDEARNICADSCGL